MKAFIIYTTFILMPFQTVLLSQNGGVFYRTDGKHVVYFDKNSRELESEEQSVYYREITYKDHKPYGVVKDIYISGKSKWLGMLTSERPDVYNGTCTWYSQSGNKVREVPYKMGKEHGLEIVYFANGRKMFEISFNLGTTVKVVEYKEGESGEFFVCEKPTFNKGTNVYDGEYIHYSKDKVKLSVFQLKNGTRTKLWSKDKNQEQLVSNSPIQVASKQGVDYFIGEWIGSEPHPAYGKIHIRILIRKDYSGVVTAKREVKCDRTQCNDANAVGKIFQTEFEKINSETSAIKLSGQINLFFGYNQRLGWHTMIFGETIAVKKTS